MRLKRRPATFNQINQKLIEPYTTNTKRRTAIQNHLFYVAYFKFLLSIASIDVDFLLECSKREEAPLWSTEVTTWFRGQYNTLTRENLVRDFTQQTLNYFCRQHFIPERSGVESEIGEPLFRFAAELYWDLKPAELLHGMATLPDGKRLVDQQLLSPIPPPPSSPPPPM